MPGYCIKLQEACDMQGFGRVGGSGTNTSGSGTGQRGIDQSLGSHLPQGQNVGSSSGQVSIAPMKHILRSATVHAAVMRQWVQAQYA